MSDKELFKVSLKIYPKDVFRLLALRSIAETDGLFEDLLRNFDEIFEGIGTTPRLNEEEFGRNPFNYTHNGLEVKEERFDRMTERQLCAAKTAFFGKEFDDIGMVLDYEVPLDDKKDSALGKIDLVSKTDSELFLLEVKKCESNEHPLRAMFEIFTFWRTLAVDGGYTEFLEKYSQDQVRTDVLGLKVVPALLLCASSHIFNVLNDARKDGKAETELYRKFLSDDIGMRVFVYDRNTLDVKEVTGELKSNLEV